MQRRTLSCDGVCVIHRRLCTTSDTHLLTSPGVAVVRELVLQLLPAPSKGHRPLQQPAVQDPEARDGTGFCRGVG
jgi:hypothetical protein